MPIKLLYTTHDHTLITDQSPKNNEQRMKPYLIPHVGNSVNTNSLNNFPPQYYSGPQLKNLYSIPTVTPATPSTKVVKIAIVVAFAYPKILSDLKTYWQNNINFGLSSTPPKVNIYTLPGATYNIAWAKEACLDLQIVCTMNPNANICLVQAKSDSVVHLMAAVTYANNNIRADIITMSWGGLEGTYIKAYNYNFLNTNVCYCASTGDSNTASWPSTLSNCISVGGTTLLWTPSTANPRTEYTWNNAGCGYSGYILQPDYQKNVSNINHTYRAVPDLSLIANPQTSFYSVFNGNWYGVGGTSLSTPIFSAILSIANQLRFNNNKSALTTVYTTLPNPPSNNVQNYLYKTLYTNPSVYANAFYDIVSGTNMGSISGNSANTILYNSSTNFDLPTGLGSPNANILCNLLLNM